MKVGIITLFDLHNVGNRLQNYAVSSVLNKMGYSCETIVPRMPPASAYRKKIENMTAPLLKEFPERAQQEYPKTCKFLREMDGKMHKSAVCRFQTDSSRSAEWLQAPIQQPTA